MSNSNGTEQAVSVAPARQPSLLSAIKESLRGSHADYTAVPIGHAIMLLAIPMVLETVLESVFAVTDVFFVAKLGPDAIATVGLTESMLTLIYALAMGLGIGATAMVARRIGEQNPNGASRTGVQAILLGLMLAVIIGITGVLTAPNLLSAMGASPSVIANGSTYTRVMLGGNAAILMLFLINAIFRGAGDAAIAMRVLWLSNIINICLGPCLIFGVGPFPRLGVTGASIATTIGRSTGALFAFSRLLSKNGRIRVTRQHFQLDTSLMVRILRLSASGTFQVFIGMASWIGLVRIISSFGSDALAGYTIGIRVIMFALLPSWGMSNAAATMVGQALGAGKPDRAEKAVWKACFYNMCFLGLIGLAFVVLADRIVGLFTSDPAVAGYAIECLRIVACGFLFYAYGMVLTQSFNGAGDTQTPTRINIFVFWLFEIPLAYALAMVFQLGPRGVFISMAVSFSSLALISAVLFSRGKWKKKVV
ncbi:MAG TPA: MATE family efflux transporter [Blastocatellia bacterium]|nr:MATE family efflux transporter [Blastocatellia bacterium]